MLLPDARGHFDRQQPVGERRLAGQEDTSQGAAPQLANQLQFAERLSGRGEPRRLWLAAAQQMMAFQHHGQRVMPLWKSPVKLRGVWRIPVFLAQAELLIDHAYRGLLIGPNLRTISQQLLGFDDLARAPLVGHFLQQLRERSVLSIVSLMTDNARRGSELLLIKSFRK